MKSKKQKTKNKVININKRTQANKIKKLYEILVEIKALELKGANGGYYSLVDMNTAVSLYWKWKQM